MPSTADCPFVQKKALYLYFDLGREYLYAFECIYLVIGPGVGLRMLLRRQMHGSCDQLKKIRHC